MNPAEAGRRGGERQVYALYRAGAGQFPRQFSRITAQRGSLPVYPQSPARQGFALGVRWLAQHRDTAAAAAFTATAAASARPAATPFLAAEGRRKGANERPIIKSVLHFDFAPPASAVTSRLFALIPCAGTGSRSGAAIPKQYRAIAGRDMLHFSLAAFDACSEFAQTLVVIAPDDRHFDARRFPGLRYAVRRCGGASRQASVFNGLNALAEFDARDDDWVLVHDAARPGITPEMIRSLIGAVKDDPVGGIMALPVADTLKRIANDGTTRISRTEQRNGLWQAQTPQMFRIGLLREAILRAQTEGHDLTDEASAIEWIGHAPHLVQGSLRNFKVTYPEDFELADAILSAGASLQVE
jgi:2-C-methyl-D-erythritol 4-phosphate cytidylyltransferase